MPLPKGGEHYLDIALQAVKKGGIVHFYDFLHKDEFAKAKEKIMAACTKAKKRCRILDQGGCGQQGPYTYRGCVDFQVR